jgi:hypothetical protein
VGLHATPPLVAKQRTGGTVVDGTINRVLSARIEHDLGGLVALAEDPQRGLVAGAGQVGDVGSAGFGHAQTVEAEQADQGVGVGAILLGG